MAIYHLNCKIKNKKSIIKSAAYCSGTKIRDMSTGEKYNYRKKEEVIYSKILLPKFTNLKFENREYLWNESKGIKGIQVARSFILALPMELIRDQWISLVNEYCNECFINYGHIADINIHIDDKNPHVHILVTMAKVDVIGDSLEKSKNKNFDKKEFLLFWRKSWSECCNRYLPRINHISCESNSYLGVSKIPTKHVGYTASVDNENEKKFQVCNMSC